VLTYRPKMAESKDKLVYFNLRARAEATRMLYKVAEKEFVDHRFGYEARYIALVYIVLFKGFIAYFTTNKKPTSRLQALLLQLPIFLYWVLEAVSL